MMLVDTRTGAFRKVKSLAQAYRVARRMGWVDFTVEPLETTE